jgi:hypothetical protein
MLRRDGVVGSKSMPRNYMSGYSYAPIRLDPWYVCISAYYKHSIPHEEIIVTSPNHRRSSSKGQSMGRDSLASNYSMTSVLFQTAISALNHLVDEGGPFLLSVQIGAPVSAFDGLAARSEFAASSHLSTFLTVVDNVASRLPRSILPTSAPGST